MEHKIFALENEKVEKERVGEMEIQEIEDQTDLLLQIRKSCKVITYKENRPMEVLE